jgi:hypothetical protein
MHEMNVNEQAFFDPFISGMFSRRAFKTDFAVETCCGFQILDVMLASQF